MAKWIKFNMVSDGGKGTWSYGTHWFGLRAELDAELEQRYGEDWLPLAGTTLR